MKIIDSHVYLRFELAASIIKIVLAKITPHSVQLTCVKIREIILEENRERPK